MKKILSLVLAGLCGISVASCGREAVVENQTEICAFVKGVNDNKVVLDEVEYMTDEDTERIAELKKRGVEPAKVEAEEAKFKAAVDMLKAKSLEAQNSAMQF